MYLTDMSFSAGKDDVSMEWFQPMKPGTSAQVPENIRSPGTEVPDTVLVPLSDTPVRCPGEEDRVDESHDETEQEDDETEQENEQLISDIRQFADDAIGKLMSNRALFRKPLQCFIRNSKAILNDSHLVSAMHTYGRYNGAACATRRLGNKPRLQSSTQIGVQPLAVARRKIPLGGRRRLQAGRPSKSTFAAEHSLAKKRRRVAPHSLGQCVDANISLGKTHSAT